MSPTTNAIAISKETMGRVTEKECVCQFMHVLEEGVAYEECLRIPL